MSPIVIAKHLVRGGALMCAALALTACASGSSMFLAGADGGPSGVQDEPDQAEVEEAFAEPAGGSEGDAILAASGNSLLPLPAGFRQASPGALGGSNLVTAASPGSTPLVGASLGALNGGGVAVAVAGQPLASVSGAGVNVLGASPTTVVGGTVGAATSLVGATVVTATNAVTTTTGAGLPVVTTTTTSLVSTTTAATTTLVSNVSGAVMAVTGALPSVTTSPMTAMTPGATPLSTVLGTLNRPAGL